jgi:MoxR-like ATPase
MGKTTLSHTLTKVLGLEYSRIQFTSDLSPANRLGINIFDNNEQTFRFHSGPIFNQLILADVINRASPKLKVRRLKLWKKDKSV